MYRKNWWYRKNVIASKLHIYAHEDGRIMYSSSRQDSLYARAGFVWVICVNKYELNAGIDAY